MNEAHGFGCGKPTDADLAETKPGETAILRPAMKITEPTLDEEAEQAMSDLRALAHRIQELGKRITQHDYSDGINVGSAVLEWVGACGKLANKLDEVGLCQDKEGFYL